MTAYCVDERGRTFDVRTEKRFGHSPEVDELLRATIARWRFKPMIVAGVPRTTCMKQGFVILLE